MIGYQSFIKKHIPLSLYLLLFLLTVTFLLAVTPHLATEVWADERETCHDWGIVKKCTKLSPTSTYFDPKIKVTYTTRFPVPYPPWTIDIPHHLNLRPNKCGTAIVYYPYLPIRVCARTARPCRYDVDQKKWLEPDPSGNKCRIFKVTSPPNWKKGDEVYKVEKTSRKWEPNYSGVEGEIERDPTLLPEEIARPGVPLLCAYEDPLDPSEIKNNSSSPWKNSPYHEGEKAGISVGWATLHQHAAGLHLLNSWVFQDLGCVPFPLGPFPQPYMDEVEVLAPPPPPLVEEAEESTFEQPKLKVTTFKIGRKQADRGQQISQVKTIASGDCRKFNDGRKFCADISEDIARELCLYQVESGTNRYVVGCVERRNFMPVPSIRFDPGARVDEHKVIVSLGAEPHTLEAPLTPSRPRSESCATLHGVELCAYIPCKEKDENHYCTKPDNKVCINGYDPNQPLVAVADKQVDGIPGKIVESRPNSFKDGIWIYDPPKELYCFEDRKDFDGNCVTYVNAAQDPNSEYYTGGSEFNPADNAHAFDIRPLTPPELGLCTEIPAESECEKSGACIDGFVAWYDANDPYTLFKDEDCKIPAENGDIVRCWKDKSTRHVDCDSDAEIEADGPTSKLQCETKKAVTTYDATSSRYVNLPYVDKKIEKPLHYFPKVTRDGINTVLKQGWHTRLLTKIPGSKIRTVFIVAKHNKTTFKGGAALLSLNSSDLYDRYFVGHDGQKRWYFKVPNETEYFINGINLPVKTAITGPISIKEIPPIPLPINEYQLYRGVFGNPPNPDRKLVISTDRHRYDRGWDGNISEILIYNKKLAATDIQNIESYLVEKWGVKRHIYDLGTQCKYNAFYGKYCPPDGTTKPSTPR